MEEEGKARTVRTKVANDIQENLRPIATHINQATNWASFNVATSQTRLTTTSVLGTSGGNVGFPRCVHYIVCHSHCGKTVTSINPILLLLYIASTPNTNLCRDERRSTGNEECPRGPVQSGWPENFFPSSILFSSDGNRLG